VRLAEHEELGPGARSRVLRRLVAYARDLVEELLAPLRSPAIRALAPAARGVVYQIEQGLGTAVARDAEEQLAELSARDRELLGAGGVEVGGRVIYVQQLLRRRAIEQRLALCAAWFERGRQPACPAPGAVSLSLARGVEPRAYAAIGFPVFGTRAIRADVAERVHKALATSNGDAAGPETGRLASWMGCPAREVPRISAALAAP
jgi:ATP-dependent RNA helicase SUPV3L1/SUV3